MKRCPTCGHGASYKLADARRKCRQCGKRFSVRSVWAESQLPAALKHRLVEMFALGVPVYRQRFRTDTSSAARERFYRVLRACCAHAEELREPFAGVIECDESLFGGSRKGKRGWGAAGKVVVFGIVQRDGQVKAFPIPARKAEEVVNLVCAHTTPGSLYYTDDWQAYASLRVQGDHIVVRKEKGRPKGRDHINGVEGFWSYAKNWLYPYRGVPRKYFHLYLGEICYRFNHRKEDMKPLLLKLMRQTTVSEIKPILVRLV
jgi:transposase